MRSWPSSVFSSPSCLVSSSLFLDHNWPALTLPEDFDMMVSRCTPKKKIKVATSKSPESEGVGKGPRSGGGGNINVMVKAALEGAVAYSPF